MRFEFKKEFETGIDEIDREHKRFFEYMNAAVDAMDAPEHISVAVSKNILLKLAHYAEDHLALEEEHLRRTNSAELPAQLEAHREFRDKLNEMRSRGEPTSKDLGDVFIFMSKWMKSHIMDPSALIGTVRKNARKMMTDELLIGVEKIDRQHERLFEIVGRAHDALEDEMMHDCFDAIAEILRELTEYTKTHFSDEEAYMRSIGYDGLDAQIAAHEKFIDKISEIDLHALSDDEEEQRRELEGLVDMLSVWIVDHILRMDKKIVQN